MLNLLKRLVYFFYQVMIIYKLKLRPFCFPLKVCFYIPGVLKALYYVILVEYYIYFFENLFLGIILEIFLEIILGLE